MCNENNPKHSKENPVWQIYDQLKSDYEAEIRRLRHLMDVSLRINSQSTLSDTARVIVESLKEIGFDRASVWICSPSKDSIYCLWGTDGDGNICKDNEIRSTTAIPPDHGYTVEIDRSILKKKLGIDEDYVFLFKGFEEFKFEAVWGYNPPSSGFYRRDERGDNICICVKNEDKPIGLIAVDNYITKRNIDETSANLFSIIGAEMEKAVVNVALRESLAEEKERLAVTLQSIGDGVIATDIRGNIVLMNNVSERLTGWTEKESLGKPSKEIFQIINEKSGKVIENPIERVFKTGEIVELSGNIMLKAKNGTEIMISDSGSPVRDRDGNVIGAVLVFRDVTEKRKIEEELVNTQKLESIGSLAGGIAHDFNNLLTGILGNISLAKMFLDPNDKTFERLSEAEKASIAARKLTQQLLTFSKGGYPILRLVSIKDAIIDSTSFALKGSNVKCEFDIPDDLWSVEIDEGLISQAINNIVINADQAMPDGGIIKISAGNLVIGEKDHPPLISGKYIEIEIKDHGIGIPKEHLNKIFDPYWTTKQKGSGLGLTTAYSIIKKHNGYIEVKSEQHIGTTFCIYLPVKIDDYSEKQEQPNASKALKVLVMDDQEIIRDLAQAILGNLGHEIFVAKDGIDAIKLCESEIEKGKRFDIIIMDLTIPGGMGGKESVAKIREIDSDVKVIVSSGYFDNPVISNYKQYGFDGFIEKPYKAKELIKVLQDVMAQRG